MNNFRMYSEMIRASEEDSSLFEPNWPMMHGAQDGELLSPTKAKARAMSETITSSAKTDEDSYRSKGAIFRVLEKRLGRKI